MKQRWDIILAGSGGQGLGVGAELLARAAMLGRDCFVAQNQSYGGPGGSSQSSLIISDEEIMFPIVVSANFPGSDKGVYEQWEPLASKSGTIVYDSSTGISPKNRVKEYGFPFHTEALALGHSRTITVMALGTSNEILHIVPPEDFIKALRKQFKGEVLEMNIKAFNHGRSLTAG